MILHVLVSSYCLKVGSVHMNKNANRAKGLPVTLLTLRGQHPRQTQKLLQTVCLTHSCSPELAVSADWYNAAGVLSPTYYNMAEKQGPRTVSKARECRTPTPTVQRGRASLD